MTLFWLVALILLAAAFAVLVWTFVWVARLMARREREGRCGPDAETLEATALVEAPVVDVPPPPEALDGEAAAEAAAARQRRVTGAGVNATLGLILSALSCALVWASPLVLVLTGGGIYFSGQALWIGLRLLGLFIGRAAAGLALGALSTILFFAYRAGALGGLLPP